MFVQAKDNIHLHPNYTTYDDNDDGANADQNDDDDYCLYNYTKHVLTGANKWSHTGRWAFNLYNEYGQGIG